MDRLLDISVSFCMINNFSSVLGCNLMSNVLKQNQLRNTALNNTFLSSVDENTQDLTSSTLQMIRWSFHQNITPALAVLLLLIWSGPVGTWAKRLWTSHEQQVCCPLSQFPTYGYIPRRLLSIAISSTDIPTSSEVTLYIICDRSSHRSFSRRIWRVTFLMQAIMKIMPTDILFWLCCFVMFTVDQIGLIIRSVSIGFIEWEKQKRNKFACPEGRVGIQRWATVFSHHEISMVALHLTLLMT